MSLPLPKERRRATRREVRVVVEGCPGVRGAVDWVTDLSLEGMRVERRLPVWGGSELELTLRLPGDAGPLHVRARVVTGHPSGTGMRFLGLDDEGRRRIEAVLDVADE